MEMVANEIEKFFKKHEERFLPHHVNVEAIQLLDNSELMRRLKRKNPFSAGVKKAIPLQAWTSPEGSRRLRFPDFKINPHMKVVRLSVLRTCCLYP